MSLWLRDARESYRVETSDIYVYKIENEKMRKSVRILFDILQRLYVGILTLGSQPAAI